MNTKQSISPKKTMLTMLFVFCLPILLAYTVYYYRDSFNFTTTNVGSFIQPTVPLSNLHLSDAQQRNFDAAKLDKKWTIAYFDTKPCLQDCRLNLAKLESVYWALGENIEAAERLFVHAPGTVASRDLLDSEKSTLPIAQTNNIETLAQFIHDSSGQDNASAQFYIIDPNGQLILHYDSDIAGNGILRDIRHLLKVNHG